MNEDKKFSLTLFDSLTDVDVKEDNRRHMSWGKIVECLSYPRVKNRKESVQMFTGAEFESGSQRNADNIMSYHMLVLDYDGDVHPNFFVSTYSDYEFVIYASYNHHWNKASQEVDKEVWKFRVVMPLANPVSAEDYREAKPVLMDKFPDADPAGFNVSQAFYLPSSHFERQEEFFVDHNKGKLLDFTGMKMDILLKKAGQLIEQTNRQHYSDTFGFDSTLQDAKKLLGNMSADCDYDTWWKVGSTLKTLFGDTQECFDVWDDWSSTGSSYSARTMQRKWSGFSESPFSYGWLVNRQKEHRR